jgi:type I restriction enzyme S subunit
MTVLVSNSIDSRSNVVVIKLGEAIEIVSGAPFKSELFNEVGDGLPLIRVRDVNTGPAGVYYSGEFSNDHLIKNGDLLVSMDGDFKVVRWAHGNALLNQRVCKISSKQDILSSHYLGHFLPNALQVVHRDTTFTTVKHLSVKAIKDIDIPLPSIDDQIRIAHLLGKVEALIAQRKHHLQQLDDLLKSVFLEMFGDPIINPRKFPVRRLSEFYVNPKEGTKCGPFGSALKKDELVNAGVPVWNMDNIAADGQMVSPFRMWITNEKYEELSAYSVRDGDIIISRAGTVGKMCVARMDGQPAIISTNLIRLRLGSELRPLHFVSLMLYCKGRVGRLKTGADGAFTHMNTGVLDSLEFPYPTIEIQGKFGGIAEKIEGIKRRYQKSLINLEALYASLSHRAFSGE